MAKGIGGFKGIQTDRNGLVDLAQAKKRDTQQRSALNLGVLPEHMDQRRIAFGGIQLKRPLKLLLGLRNGTGVQECHPAKPVSDDTAGFKRLACCRLQKELRHRRSVVNAPAAHVESELSE